MRTKYGNRLKIIWKLKKTKYPNFIKLVLVKEMNSKKETPHSYTK
jgi:hypothetical protein